MAEPLEQLVTRDGTHRISIVRRADGLYSLDRERLVATDDVHAQDEGWVPYGRDVVLADTMERARELAREELSLFD